jgi:hypothetical protein
VLEIRYMKDTVTESFFQRPRKIFPNPKKLRNYHTYNRYKTSKQYKRLSKNWQKIIKRLIGLKIKKSTFEITKKQLINGREVWFIRCGIYKSFLIQLIQESVLTWKMNDDMNTRVLTLKMVAYRYITLWLVSTQNCDYFVHFLSQVFFLKYLEVEK